MSQVDDMLDMVANTRQLKPFARRMLKALHRHTLQVCCDCPGSQANEAVIVVSEQHLYCIYAQAQYQGRSARTVTDLLAMACIMLFTENSNGLCKTHLVSSGCSANQTCTRVTGETCNILPDRASAILNIQCGLQKKRACCPAGSVL